jgi:hypothetical protein
MKESMSSAAICLFIFAAVASAYEYPLQFTPNPGYRGLVVAGYEIDATGVTGNCSYYTVQASSGRGGGYHSSGRAYQQTCRWDLYGNLLSITPGAPAVPAPLYTDGTTSVYAHSVGGGYTGTDPKLPHGGFVNTPGSHYVWLTTDAATQQVQQAVDSITLTLKSDGDVPLHISSVEAAALLAKAAVQSCTCIGTIAVGSTCSIAVAYDPTGMARTLTGQADDTLTVSVISDAGQANDFLRNYAVAVGTLVSTNDN